MVGAAVATAGLVSPGTPGVGSGGCAVAGAAVGSSVGCNVGPAVGSGSVGSGVGIGTVGCTGGGAVVGVGGASAGSTTRISPFTAVAGIAVPVCAAS
jgi:hypothetical protein